MAELLAVPWKKSSDVDIVKPLRNLIQSTYSGAEGAEACSEALEELARLRTNAIWKGFDKSSLDGIYSYYDQLVSLESKVPPQEVQIPFKWKDAFDRGSIFGGRMSLSVSSLAFERVCVLFNIGAGLSALAQQQPLDSEESLKHSAKVLQQAAGVFAHLKATVLLAVHQEPTPDLQADTLGALAALMLAQAQEVIAYKCIRDEMKDSMVAKVCAHADELYTDALRSMQKDHLKPLWEREWLPTVQAKQAAFKGLAQLHQAQVCAQQTEVGEQIARLQLASDQLKAATAKLANVAPLTDAAARAARQLTAALKDNDFIYHARVPDATQLEPIARAAIAKPLTPPERWSSGGKDLFASLVPLAVHQAQQSSTARRQEMVHAEVDKLRDATQLLNSILASLSLPACVEAGAEAGGLPASIRGRAQEVREAGGLPALTKLMADLPELLQRNKEILDEASRMLREEAEADAALRTQFGARWTRTASDSLTENFRANAAKYAQIIDNAVRADHIVQQKFQQHKDAIAMLERSDGELQAQLPAAEGGGGGGAEGPAEALRQLMRDVDELKAERAALEAELQATTLDLRDSFMQALAASGAVDEPAISASALGQALAPLQRRSAASLQRQEALLARVQEQHQALVARRGGSSGRDAMLARLQAAADAYTELSNNLQEGVKFYNDLTQLLVAFQNKVSDFCFARKTEKEELLKDLTQEASRPTTAHAQRPAPAPPAQNEAGGAQRPSTSPAAPAAPPAASALPYPAQPQGMPLPYGAPAAAPYPYYAAPPMPAMYNPYATLPYPHHARLPTQPYQPYQYPQTQPYGAPPPAGYNPYPPQQ